MNAAARWAGRRMGWSMITPQTGFRLVDAVLSQMLGDWVGEARVRPGVRRGETVYPFPDGRQRYGNIFKKGGDGSAA